MHQLYDNSYIYTGPVDEYFDYRYGKLPYRSLEFRHETLDKLLHLPVAVVNYPNEHAYTRITEFKYLTGQQHPKTSIVYEYPQAEGDPYYPVPRPENAETYNQYKKLADATPHVYFVGRLATYKYYNMDQVVAQALTLFKKLSKEEPPCTGSNAPQQPPSNCIAVRTRAGGAPRGSRRYFPAPDA